VGDEGSYGRKPEIYGFVGDRLTRVNMSIVIADSRRCRELWEINGNCGIMPENPTVVKDIYLCIHIIYTE